MAEGGVADFHGGLGDVMASFQEQLGGAFHADLPEVLRNGHADFLGEEAAEVEGAAADLRAEGLDVGRLGEVSAEDGGGAFDALAGDPFLALAEELGLGAWAGKGSGRGARGSWPGTQSFLRGLRDGRLAQGLESEFLAGGHGAYRSGRSALVDEPAAQRGMEVVLHGVDLGLEIIARELDSDEGVGLTGGTVGFEIGLGVAVETDGMGGRNGPRFSCRGRCRCRGG